MKRILVLLGVMGSFFVVCGEDVPEPQTDSEAWNQGVDYYRAGDVTNALRLLRPLMLTRTHGARAAEVVAAIEYEKGDLDRASEAAQVVLRANPSDPKAHRNFTRATDRLLALREQRHIEQVMRASQGQDPGALLQGATYEARELMKGWPTLVTNPPVLRVASSSAFASRATALADVWIPVREVIVQNVTNEEQAATILTQIDQAQKQTKQAAIGLEDMEENAYSSLADVEHALTRFLKLSALPPVALAEDEKAQTNAWIGTESFNGRAWQTDALDFTRAFRAKFPAWARVYEQQAQSDTNKPLFTAEDQAKVSALATELEKVQLACVEQRRPADQARALEIIRQIQALMPKDPKGGQGSGGGDNQQKQEPNPKDGKQPEPQQPPSQTEQETSTEASESEEDGDKDVESVLKKAQERSDEHEAEKKARMRKQALPPNARDW